MADTQTFLSLRPRLFKLAYRMLGSRQDAEDAVQEAYLRWHNAKVETIVSREAWLVTLTTRLCIDRLRALKNERDAYSGPWLPEPLIDAEYPAPEVPLELAGEVSIAFMLMLERLGPEERAAFLLRDIFDFDYADLAQALARSQGACRQLVSRARAHLNDVQVHHAVPEVRQRELLGNFIAATKTGDLQRIVALLAPNATLTADGGGVANTVFRVLHGAERIGRLFHVVARQVQRHGARLDYEVVRINGAPGLLRRFSGQLHSALAFDWDDARIRAIYIVANPAKLRGAR